MLEQFQSVKKMGSMQSLLDMMPGMSGVDASQMDLGALKRNEAIIQSMTYKERLNHLIIGPSRRKRIAKGSGTTVAEVNKLLKQFEKTKLMMKKVSRNKGMQGKLMNQMGIDPSMMGGLGGAGGMGGMGGLPAGMDLNSLKGMDMKKLQELAKRFK
jgi:signal recognition particle subunit SRP54